MRPVRPPRLVPLLLALLVGCAPGFDEADDPAELTLETTTQAVVNGTRAPTLVPLTEGEALAIGWLHPSGYPADSFCTATLIDPFTVLTAAHCVREQQGTPLGFGMGVMPTQPMGTVLVSRSVLHPTLDLALLTLEEDARRAVPDIVPIAPNATPLEQLSESLIGRSAEAAGYGGTLDPDRTGRYFVVLQIVELRSDYIKVHGHGERGLCHGDSGAPLLLAAASGQPLIVGVERGGSGDCVHEDWLTRTDRAVGWLETGLETPKADSLSGVAGPDAPPEPQTADTLPEPSDQPAPPVTRVVNQGESGIETGCQQSGGPAPLAPLLGVVCVLGLLGPRRRRRV